MKYMWWDVLGMNTVTTDNDSGFRFTDLSMIKNKRRKAMDDTLADLSVLNPVHHTHRVASAILMLSHDQLVLEQVTYQLPVPPKGSHPPGQHPDGIHHGQPLVDVLLVDFLALASTIMVHNHHDVPQLVYLHALLHVRLPQQHLLLHCGSKGKSTMLVLKLGHKFNFLEDLVPNKSDMSMEVTTAITTVQPHTTIAIELAFYFTELGSNLATFTGSRCFQLECCRVQLLCLLPSHQISWLVVFTLLTNIGRFKKICVTSSITISVN